MTANRLDDRRRSVKFGDVIANATVRALFHELIDILSNLHEDVEVLKSEVDIRAEYTGITMCRVVPYRELFHLHVGANPIWEVRVRNEASYLDAVDRILDEFLSLAALDGRKGPRPAGASTAPR
jgi:hypothetical protein